MKKYRAIKTGRRLFGRPLIFYFEFEIEPGHNAQSVITAFESTNPGWRVE